MSEDFDEQPIAWKVSAVDGRREFVDPHKYKAHGEQYESRELAETRKRDLQACGLVATVTPVFLGKAKVKAGLRKRQGALLGDTSIFCANWKMHQ